MHASKKQILFISSWYPTRLDTYRGDFVQRHAMAVASRHFVTVIHAIGDPNISQTEVVENFPVQNMRELILYFPKSRYRWVNAWRKFMGYIKLNKKVENADLIHAHVIYTDLFWVLWQRVRGGLPYVVTEHSTRYYNKLSWFQKYFAKIFAHKSEYILPVSTRLQTAMESHGIMGVYRIIPNVVDTENFKPKSQPEQKSLFRFLHISMLNDAHKNISGQLEAVKKLKELGYEFEYHIGGNGDLQPIIEYVSKHQLGDCVKIFGALTHEEVSVKMREADAFILFSNRENQPCVIIESFASGTPVIATDVGGVSEFFPEGFGALVPKGDVNALVDEMIKMMNDSTLNSPAEMHAYAEKKFSVNSIAQQLDEVYDQVLAVRNTKNKL
ncbi:MAG: glycosyltransferase [Weeksellaceae bacterium]|nr:glycosyltransferase [Weeksellaceae bacterium]